MVALLLSNLQSTHPRTTLAFILAPGLAALVGAGGIATCQGIDGPSDHLGPILVGTLYLAYGFALVGYVTALIVAVPLYILLPEHARRAFWVVVPLAGGIAATPWIQVIAICRLEWLPVGVAFGLGCVAGFFFLLIRTGPRLLSAYPGHDAEF